jgi:hypothetical protein
LEWARFFGHLKHITAIWSILWPFGTVYGHLVIKWQFGIFSPVLVYCVWKNPATLFMTLERRENVI